MTTRAPTPETESPPAPPAGAGGVAVIEARLKTMPSAPGVYRMVGAGGDVLYVGKAKNLKKRVASYANLNRQPTRLLRMISETHDMEIVTTHTEAEALLLEANLIKTFRPRYNILLRDDKSFPLILIAGGHDYPRVMKHRGQIPEDAESFGPFASAGAVNRALATLQRAFLLRTCSDTVFANRDRPCLLYQIKRCAAPCVGRIDKAAYAKLVAEARTFLKGGNSKIQKDLAARMQAASDRMDFEDAADLRDRIAALTRIQGRQDIHLAGIGDADVIALGRAGAGICIQVFFFRGGANFGNRAYFPAGTKDMDDAAILSAFIGQFYDDKMPPAAVLVSARPADQALLAEALSIKANRKVTVTCPQRGEKADAVTHAVTNAREALARRLAESASQRKLLDGLADVLGMEAAPERIEVYDNSHVSGTHAVGGMIVAGPDGFIKSAYRKFNIKGTDKIAPGDDYAMMREVLTRRFSRAQKEDPDRTSGTWPDLILIDGGRGQLGIAEAVFDELGIDDVMLVAISKGPDRNAGREKIHLPARPGAGEPKTRLIELGAKDEVLYFLQRLRDEAHRYAIGTHRARRSKGISRSALDGIPGIGAKRKKALLHHFGSARAVGEAGLADLEAVDGISGQIAEKIYGWFHPDG